MSLHSYTKRHIFIARCEPQHVGDVVMQNSKMHITKLSECIWIVTNSDKIHGQCKIL